MKPWVSSNLNALAFFFSSALLWATWKYFQDEISPTVKNFTSDFFDALYVLSLVLEASHLVFFASEASPPELYFSKQKYEYWAEVRYFPLVSGDQHASEYWLKSDFSRFFFVSGKFCRFHEKFSRELIKTSTLSCVETLANSWVLDHMRAKISFLVIKMPLPSLLESVLFFRKIAGPVQHL